MEIERKWLIDKIPFDLQNFSKKEIEQAYLCTNPVLRIRKTDDKYGLTYKGEGLVAREEHNLPFSKEGYDRLISAAEGIVLTKTRYLIPCDPYTIELDVFHGVYEGLVLAEVEFPSLEECNAFIAPSWFGEDVSESGKYQNSRLCRMNGLQDLQ